jgi:hypothetical protein
MIGGIRAKLRSAALHEGLFHPRGATFIVIDSREIRPSQKAVLRLRNASSNLLAAGERVGRH